MEDISGYLTIRDKIWFNEKGYKCRLRICGFTKEQIEKMQDSSFIDITLDQRDGKQEFVIEILEKDNMECSEK